jgi:hypothetical protein
MEDPFASRIVDDAQREWRRLSASDRQRFVTEVIVRVVDAACQDVQVKSEVLKGSSLHETLAREQCREEGKVAQWAEAFLAFKVADPAFQEQAQLFTRCEKFGDENATVLNQVLQLMMDKVADDRKGERLPSVYNAIIGNPAQVQTFLTLAGLFMAKFPAGNPKAPLLRLWTASMPELRLKATADAEEAARAVLEYVQDDAHQSGFLFPYVLWRMRNHAGVADADSLAHFSREDISSMLLGLMLNSSFVVFKNLKSFNGSQRKHAVATLDALVQREVGGRLALEDCRQGGPFDWALNFLSFVEYLPLSMADLSLKTVPAAPERVQRMVRVERDLILALPWDKIKPEEVTRVRRMRLGRLLLDTGTGATLAVPMHVCCSTWMAAVDKCQKDVKKAKERGEDKDVTQCLALIVEASAKFQTKLGVPQEVQARFLENKDVLTARPVFVDLRVTRSHLAAARLLFEGNVLEPMRPKEEAALLMPAAVPAAVPAPSAAIPVADAIAPYLKMLKVGTPEGAVVQRMKTNNVPEAVIQAFLAEANKGGRRRRHRNSKQQQF